MDAQAGSVGFAHLYVIRADHQLQPEVPGMPQRP